MKQLLYLKTYIEALEKARLLREVQLPAADFERSVEHLSFDSRDVVPGTLFICKGLRFQEHYLDVALTKGAFVYVCEKEFPKRHSAILVNDIRQAMAVLANLFYAEPWRDFNLTGITGTKGKTSTTYYLKSILDEALRDSGKVSGLISSIDVYDGKTRSEATLTTPESLTLMQHLSNASESLLPYVSMEVSSQALRYDRVSGIHFNAAALLNISEDHISL